MKSFILFITFIALTASYTYSQDTIYIDNLGEKIKNKQLAESYKFIIVDSTAIGKAKFEREYYLSGKLKSITHYVSILNEKTKKNEFVKDGQYKMWYESGELKREINYRSNLFDGKTVTFWPNKKLKRDDLYKAGKLINGTCYTEEGYQTDHYPLEQQAEFPNRLGNLYDYISHNLKYPVDAQESHIEGTVIISFIVEPDGQITHIRIVRKLYPSLDAEAFRVIFKMPKWKPYSFDGETHQAKYTIPVGFRMM